MNSILNIDSSDDNQEIEDSSSDHRFPEKSTKTSPETIVEEMDTVVGLLNKDSREPLLRVSDILGDQEENERVDEPDGKKIRRTNLNDCALLLARDRARKTLERSKKSDIISNIMNNCGE